MLKLRDYQLEAVDFLSERGGYLADDMGLGKTPTTLSMIRADVSRQRKPLVLVVGGSFGLSVWQDELEKWYPDTFNVMYYQGPNRKSQFADWYTTGGICLVNYSSVYNLITEIGLREWHVLVVDEGHRYRSRTSRMYKALEAIQAKRTYVLSGSPVVSHMADLWLMLHIIDRERFPSYWNFIETYFYTQSDGYKMVPIKARYEKHEELRALLNSYIIRRKEGDPRVARELPPRMRVAISLELTEYQQRIYDGITRDWQYTDIEGHIHALPNVLAVDTRLRQVLITPALIGLRNSSAVLSALAEHIQLDIDANRNIVVFTPFNGVMPYIRAYAATCGIPYAQLVGGMTPQRFSAELANWRVVDGPKLLCAQIAIAQAWSATEAQSAYFIGLDWSATALQQAEKRLHREGQTGTVLIRYFKHKGTIDDHILELLDGKYTQANNLDRLTQRAAMPVHP